MGPTVKDSPPSSPQLENIGGVAVGKRKRKSNDSSSSHTQHILQQSANMMPKQNMHANEEKDIKVFQNNVSAPHMLGNQLNPSSTMAQKMSDTLSQELEAHSIFTESGNTSSNLIGPPLVNRAVSADKSATSTPNPTNSFSTIFSTNNGGQNSMLGNGAIPQTLDQLLERQWEQGSQFLMEQAQHFDIASLLSCLHQLRAENLRLEDHVNSLLQRRDHLLAVNARLAIPLTSVSNTHNTNTVHANINSQLNIPNSEMQSTTSNISKTPRDSRVNTNYMMHTSTSGHSSVVTDNKPNIQNNVSTEPLLRQQYSQRPTSNPSQQNSNIRY